MDFFNTLGKKITQTSQDAVKKTKNMTEIMKLNSMISDEEKHINEFYLQIGRAYYQKYVKRTEDEFQAFMTKITEAGVKIAELTEQIMQIKGIAVCPYCNAEIQYGVVFCSSCGKEIAQQVTVADETAVGSEQVCTGCGSELPEGGRFCVKCGQKVEG